MAFIFSGLLIVIFLFCLAFLAPEGLWSNTIRFVNVLTAALIAVNFWEPAARLLDSTLPAFTYLWDMVALWGIFTLMIVIFRTAARNVSVVKVRFEVAVEQVGTVVCAALVGWVMVCFTTMALHTAPLGEKFLWGGFDPNERMLVGLAPDRQLLGFVSYVSTGSLSCLQTRPFDPNQKFIETYTLRRGAFETHFREKKSVSVGTSRTPKR